MSTSHLGLAPFDFTTPASLIAFNWLYAYGVLSSRTIKQIYGIDNNISPRDNIATYAEQAVRDGKLTRAQVDMVKRTEAASANSTVGFTLFVASVLFAIQAGVPSATVNTACFAYTAARLAYGPLYILIDSHNLSFLRSAAWWAANISCLSLLYQGAKAHV